MSDYEKQCGVSRKISNPVLARAQSREEVVALDIHLEIQRYNVPLATKPNRLKDRKSRTQLDFIGNCQKWNDEMLAGLFGPDIIFADLVMMGQLQKLRKNIPSTLSKHFVKGPSWGEIVYYYYRYHLARTRHCSSTRTLHSPKSKRKHIYQFFLKEYPNDPTNKLLSLTLKQPDNDHSHEMKVDKPSVTVVNNLISALAAWAFQTQHILAPHQTILKILFKTLGTESEFDCVRMELARHNIRIYIAEEDIIKARGWIPSGRTLSHGGTLVCKAADDLEQSEEEEEEERRLTRSAPYRERISLVNSKAMSFGSWSKNATVGTMHSRTTFTAQSKGTNSIDVTYKSLEVLQKGTPSLVPCNEDRQTEIQRLGSSKRSITRSELAIGTHRKKSRATPHNKLQHTRSSTILFLNSPEMVDLQLNSSGNVLDSNWSAGEQKQSGGAKVIETRKPNASNESQGTASPSLVFANEIYGNGRPSTRSVESSDPEVLKIQEVKRCCQIS